MVQIALINTQQRKVEMDTFTKEHLVRVYDDKEGVCLQVCPNPEAPDFGVAILTIDPKSENWYGATRLCVKPNEALALAAALIDVVKHNNFEGK